ncbi:MAG: alpha/beta hydrolase [Caulobacteraceae bacterium]|nr:alpha/beta hydrolase [Caulobacteraceae bacterium]
MDAAVFREPRRRMIAIKSRAGDGQMAALDFGDAARPVDLVFVHANGFNAMTYRGVLGPLALGLRVLAVDQRGHGDTPLRADPRGRRNWHDLRDDLVGLLDSLEAEGGAPLVLSGHSMGATASLLAAAERPRRVSRLVLFEPVILPRRQAWMARLPMAASAARNHAMVQAALRRRAVFDSRQAAFAAYLGRGAFKTWPETALADFVAGGFKDRPDGKVELACAPAWEASNYAAQGHDPWRAAARLRRPIHILRAQHGSTCALRPGAGFLRRRPNIQVETIDGATHFLPMERPDLVREALLDAAV